MIDFLKNFPPLFKSLGKRYLLFETKKCHCWRLKLLIFVLIRPLWSYSVHSRSHKELKTCAWGSHLFRYCSVFMNRADIIHRYDGDHSKHASSESRCYSAPYCHFIMCGLYLAKCGHVQLTKPFAINEKLDNEVNSTDHLIWSRFLHLIKGVSSACIRFHGILTGTQIAC